MHPVVHALLLWLVLPVLVVYLVSQILIFLGWWAGSTGTEYYGRSAAGFLALTLCAVYGTLSSAVLSAVGRGGLGQWTTARAFKWAMLLLTEVWFDVDDPHAFLRATRPAVFLANHQSELDVLLLGHVLPPYCSVTAKKSLKWVPLLGWFMALSKTVFIERASRTKAVAAFDLAARQMHRTRQSVLIFPEGTRSYAEHPTLLPFKKGAFHLAVQAQVPIVPIVAANYAHLLLARRRRFRPGAIPVRVLDPIPTKGKSAQDVPDLLRLAEDRMLAALRDLAPAPSPSSSTTTGAARGALR